MTSSQSKTEVYFVSDVHLGLKLFDPKEREERFIAFLKAVPRNRVRALYLLGDIWDFWYEYRDVVPRYGAKVVSALVSLMDEGVEVWFCPGNHDIWTYSYFEELGMHRFDQPFFTEIGGKTFCLGHGDLLGGAPASYSFMLKVFRCRFIQKLFSTLHPWIAFRIGLGWSNSNRRRHHPYHFKGEQEPLYKFAKGVLSERHVDYFVFGHFHDSVYLPLGEDSHLCVLKDWISGGTPHACFNGEEFTSFSPDCQVVRS